MEIFKKEMKLLGLNPVRVAKKLKISRQAIYAWCSGKYRPTSISVPKLKLMGFSDTACLLPDKDVEV